MTGLISGLALMAALLGADVATTGEAETTCSAVLNHTMRPLAGKNPESLCAYQGKVLLIVNTASKCGLTPQYDALEAMHARLAPQGFAVIGFPSNDFMGQEPGTEEEIQAFCKLTYGVTFPMYEKVVVKGEAVSPIYRVLSEATGEAPAWNFHKYLVDRNGQVVASFGSRTKPDDAALLAKIDQLLAETPKK